MSLVVVGMTLSIKCSTNPLQFLPSYHIQVVTIPSSTFGLGGTSKVLVQHVVGLAEAIHQEHPIWAFGVRYSLARVSCVLLNDVTGKGGDDEVI